MNIKLPWGNRVLWLDSQIVVVSPAVRFFGVVKAQLEEVFGSKD